MNVGNCKGGPLNGQVAVSRFPLGFLLVDKVADQCWLYQWNTETQEFNVRQEAPMDLDYAGRIRAAEESDYDVLVAEGVISDGDARS